MQLIHTKIADFGDFLAEVPTNYEVARVYWEDIMDVDRVFCEYYCEACEAYPGHKAHEAHSKGIENLYFVLI